MDIQSYHPFNKIISTLIISILLLFGVFHLTVLAQEPPPFEISLIPADTFAVSGQIFTYTVIITNVSPNPVQHPVIDIEIPDGTKFVRTQHTSKKWFGGNQLADPNAVIEQITLYSIEPVAALEVFSFAMIVEVPAQADQEVVIENYQVMAPEQTSLPVSGPTIKTKILTPTPIPTWTPTPSPSPTLTPIPPSTATPQTVAENNQTFISATATAINTPEPRPVLTSPAQTELAGPASNTIYFLIAVLMVGGVVALIGIGWFVRKNR